MYYTETFLGLLAGIFDGHGGAACAQVIAKRIFHYITACLLPQDRLREYFSSVENSNSVDLIRPFNDEVQFVDDVRDLYRESFINFLRDLSKVRENERIITCFFLK